MEETPSSDLLTVAQTTKYLRISRTTLIRLTHAGKGPTQVKIGRRVFYKQADLDAFILAASTQPSGE
jgi:excisionase family DNA binding protein